MIDDTLTAKTGDDIPNVGEFYDHAEGKFICGQDLVYTYYTDEKTGYPLGFRLYEEDSTKIDQAKELIKVAEEKADISTKIYLFDAWFCAAELIKNVESYDKAWISVLNSDRLVEFDGEDQRIDAVHEQVELTHREIDDEDYKIWTKKFPVSTLGEQKVISAEKVTDDEDEANPVKYLVANQIDAPSTHIIRSYGFRWRIETFFEDSKQDLGVGDCEVERSTSARRHWHMVMLADSLLRLGPAESADNAVQPTTTSLRAGWEWSLQDAIYNLVSWVRENKDRAIQDIMAEFDDLFINVRC